MVLKRPRPQRATCLLAAALVACALASAPARAVEDEYALKAAFLYHFGQFVEWPPESEASRDAFVIGILGRDPFGEALDALESETVRGRPVRVRRFSRADQIDRCDVLYISPSEASRVRTLLKVLGGRRVLTVSDIEGFTRWGGIIHLTRAGDRIGFAINKRSADAEGLRISSQLLNLAQRVIA